MQFKRLKDDSVETVDGRIILYSVTRFLDEIANGDGCFICGAKPGTKEFRKLLNSFPWFWRRRWSSSWTITTSRKRGGSDVRSELK